jgi:hypothetical protein
MVDKNPLTTGLMSSTLAANHRLPPPPYWHTCQLQSRLTDAARGVRAKVTAAHRDPSTDQMFLQTLLSEDPAQEALRAPCARD